MSIISRSGGSRWISVRAGVRAAASLLHPADRLSILIYHRVLGEADPLLGTTVVAADFRWQMQTLARHFNPLPLGEAVRRLHAGTLPPRAVCVTFDDGYADNAVIALPILRETGVTATFFIASAFLDGGRMWNDTVFETLRRLPAGRHEFSEVPGLEAPVQVDDGVAARIAAAEAVIAKIKYLPMPERGRVTQRLARRVRGLPDDLMMSSTQVRELHAAGMMIGAHTENHPILARLPADEARREIVAGRERLEAIIDTGVDTFAYPNGRPGKDYLPEHVAMVSGLGFCAAVSTSPGVSGRCTDRFQLSRFTPWDRTPARFAARLLMNARRVTPASGH